ncbi:MAG: hypothetical protein IJX28_00260 [Clostridia bacterium]|nr:hypothetical protein [Clostridia bacterium]
MEAKKRELTSTQIGAYIRQAADLEKDIYTLQESEKAFVASANELRQKDLSPVKPEYVDYPPHPIRDPHLTLKQQIGSFIGVALGLWLFDIIVFLIVYAIFYCFIMPERFEISVKAGGIGVLIFIFIMYFLIGENNKNSEKKYNRELGEYNSKCKSVNAKNKIIEMEYSKQCDVAKEKYKKICERADIIQGQANIIHEKLKYLMVVRNQFYSLGIIPPDYRTMDCIYVLDHIFTNDLASDVRSAILLYKDWEFRGDVIRGMSNIISRLSSIDSRMYYLTQDISSIRRTVDLMSQDTFRIAEAQTVQSRSVDMILENSKATRYASEMVQKHIEETKKYYDVK